MTSYEPIAVIEFDGSVDSDGGNSQGHYRCDIKDKEDKSWFHTSDNIIPVPIQVENVSNLPYVVLYRKYAPDVL